MKIFVGTILSCTLALSCIGAEEKIIESKPSERVEEFKVEVYKREQILPLLPLLTEWAVREFKAYPYLWALPEGQIVSASDLIVVNEKNAFMLLAKEKGQVVGLVTAMAFDSPYLKAYFEQPFNAQAMELGYDPSKMLYVSYFLTAPDRRNDEAVVSQLYNTLAELALKMGRTQLCYLEDVTRFDDTTPFAEIEPWGYAIQGMKKMGVNSKISWETIQPDGSLTKVPHDIEFSVKEI